jgi:tetratricopeptide (TPR) repeat protein
MRIGLVLLLLLCGFAGPRPASAHGAYHDVVADLRARLGAKPDDTALRLQLAAAHVEHGEWQACLDEVSEIEALAPGLHPTGSLSGRALAGLERFEEAVPFFEAHLAEQPGDPIVHVARARIRLKQGHVKEGIEDFRAALRSSAKPELYVETCEALRRNGMAREALAVVDEGVVRCGADPAILVCAVECAVELGEVDAGIAYLDRLQRVWPRPEPWMQRKAEFLAQAGRNEEATAAWRSLHDHLLALPNLERSQPLLADTLAACRRALGIETPPAVVAPPAD